MTNQTQHKVYIVVLEDMVNGVLVEAFGEKFSAVERVEELARDITGDCLAMGYVNEDYETVSDDHDEEKTEDGLCYSRKICNRQTGEVTLLMVYMNYVWLPVTISEISFSPCRYEMEEV